MKTWKEIALQYHIILADTKYVLEKNFMPDNTAEKLIIKMNKVLRENLSEIKKLNENEMKMRKK